MKDIFYLLIQRESKNRKGELEMNGDKVPIKPGRNLKVKNDSGKVQYIGAKHKNQKKEESQSQYIRAKHKNKEQSLRAIHHSQKPLASWHLRRYHTKRKCHAMEAFLRIKGKLSERIKVGRQTWNVNRGYI